MPGLNPGCLAPLAPLLLVTGNESSRRIPAEHVGFASIQCLSGDTSVQIDTYNTAFAAADRAFVFMAYRPGNNQILPASAHPDATQCTVNPDGTVECV